MRTMPSERRSHRLLTIVVVLVVTLMVGVVTGTQLPWGADRSQEATGVAMKANDENDLVLFDADDGMQLSISVEAIAWQQGDTSGQSRPPCLTEALEPSRVRVGYVEVTLPVGATQDSAVWLECL